jgi:ketosteroid isomerase-like protein
MNAIEKAVAAILAQYQDALNRSDTDAVMKLYASDRVFMPQTLLSTQSEREVACRYPDRIRVLN